MNVMIGRNNRYYRADGIGCADARGLSPGRLRYRGAVLIWTALLLVVMIGFVGLSIDWAKVGVNVHQMQNAADAAALAGAQIVKRELPQVTRQRTHDIGFANAAEGLAVYLRYDSDGPIYVQPQPFSGDEASFDILLGRWVRYNRTFVPTLDAANAVMAVARRNTALGITAPALRLLYVPLFGVDPSDAERLGVAWCYDSGGFGLICLSNPVPGDDPGLWITGTADLDIDGGGIHVNSTAVGNNQSAGGWVSGTALLDCGFINVVGGIDPPADSSVWEGIFEGGIEDGAEGFSVADVTTIPAPQHIDDPLAAAMMADATPYVLPPGDHLDVAALLGVIPTYNIPTVTGTATLAPGYYPNGIDINYGNTVTLQPNSTSGLGTLFIFGGAGMQVKGNLVGQGVTCYITKNFTTGQIGLTDWGAGALIDLWSPGDWQNKDVEPPDLPLVQGLNGVVVWQDPTMVDSHGDTPDAHLNGSPEGGVHGTIYFPDPIHIELNGDLGQLGNQILCGSAKINGTATISVDYDGRNTPQPTNQSILVR